MSVTQLRTPVVAGHVAVAVAEIEAAAVVPVGSLEREELPVALADLARLEAMVCALKLQVLAESDRRQLAEDVAATGTPAWAAKLTGSTQKLMAGGLYYMNLLNEKYHATRAAFADGGIELDQAKAIVRAAEKIPAAATEQERSDAEASLVAKAVDGEERPWLFGRRAAGCSTTSTGGWRTSRKPACSRTRTTKPSSRPRCMSGTTATARSRASSPSPSCTATCSRASWRTCPARGGSAATRPASRSPTRVCRARMRG